MFERPLTAMMAVALIALGAAGPTEAAAQEGPRAAALVRGAMGKLGVGDGIPAIPGVLWYEVSIQSWEGQGPSPDEADRVRVVRRRLGASVADSALVSLYRQETPLGELRWCADQRVRAREQERVDCLSGARTVTTGGTTEAVRGLLGSRVHGALLDLARRASDLGRAESGSLDGSSVWVVNDTGARRGPTRWVFSVEDSVPLEMSWVLDDPLGRAGTARDAWSDYRTVGPLMMPTRVRRTRPADASETIRVSGARIAPALPSEWLSTGRAVDVVAPRPSFAVDTVTPGIWLLRDVVPGYNSLLVNTGEGLLVVEAPGGREGAARILDTAERIAPGTKVAFAFATHFHYDHVAGLTALSRAGATVLLPPSMRRFSAHVLSIPRNRIELVERHKTLGAEGGQRVGLETVAASPHVDEMLLVRFPDTPFGFVTDLYLKEPHGVLRPASAETRPLLEWAALHPEVETFLSGHGVPFTRGDLATAELMRRARARGS